jgi:septum formation protein
VSFWLHAAPLVLASQSQSRHDILLRAGIPHEVSPANVDERQVEQRMGIDTPEGVAELLAREKALAVSVHRPGAIVLGADQTLAADGRRFSKPKDRAGAREQLLQLRNRTHELHSALALARDGVLLFEHREVARLAMRGFSETFLEKYLECTGSAVTGSVGGYQLEKIGIQLFERVDGDHFVILGLPLLPLLEFLRSEGLLMD